MKTIKLRTGDKFGYWTILKEANRTLDEHTYWKCRCECGNERFVRVTDLQLGNSKSCGCKKQELRRKTTYQNLKKKFG